jgi:hypothetical protein
MIKALALTYHRFVELSLDLTPLLSTQLHHAQTFAHAGEYA